MKLTDVLATDLLGLRMTVPPSLPRAPDPADSERAAHLDKIRQRCQQAMARCGADTTGISIFGHPQYDEMTWLAVVGEGESFQGRRYPLRHSMCGVCFDYDGPQLFIEAQRYFQWLELAGVRIAEGLVVPLRTPRGQFYGTIWAAHHNDGGHFTQADVLVLQQASEDLYALISADTVGVPGEFASQIFTDKTYSAERRVSRKDLAACHS